MLTKQVTYFGKTASGIYCQSLFGSAGAFEKTAGAPPFADWETGEQLRSFITKIGAEDRKNNLYVLVNALGAGEYFGSNINADYFPWNALCHEGKDYGYQTFLDGHAFQHHVNKDPLKAFGSPVLSLLNPSMKRVELVIKLDREKARLEKADGIITRIEAGEFPDVSMGCKVPYDVCSICGNKSKTRVDYCQHMYPPDELRGIYGPNKILPDGRKIYVINTMPRFFDISFVFIGADKTAKTMAKLAQVGEQLCMGNVCAAPSQPMEKEASRSRKAINRTFPVTQGLMERAVKKATSKKDKEKKASPTEGVCCDDCGMDKLAQAFGEKTSSQQKLSEIIKTVPAQGIAGVSKHEPSLDNNTLDEMAKKDLGTGLSTSGLMGIVLKPREFQRIILVRMGEGNLAEELDQKGEVFRNVPEFDNSIEIDRGRFDQGLAKLLSSILHLRSAFGEPIRRRLSQVDVDKKPLPTDKAIEHPVLDKISAAYNGYRRSLLTKMSQAIEVVNSDPQLREALVGNDLVNLFYKSASPIISLDSIAYLMGAHYSDTNLINNNEVVDEVAKANEWLLDGELL